MTAGCIGVPVSWLRLETFASAGGDPEAAAHLASCPACQRCLDEIRTDVVALPPLAVPAHALPAPRARRPWWHFAAPGFALAAAVAIAVVVVRPKEPARALDVASIKGGGTLVLSLVREREGVVREDVATFRDRDRWKVVVTCSPDAGAASVFVDVSVKASYSVPADFPMSTARIACGNHVVIPGAFSLDHDAGGTSYRVCVKIAPVADGAPLRDTPTGRESNVACRTITAE
jgi:hypothetical protein